MNFLVLSLSIKPYAQDLGTNETKCPETVCVCATKYTSTFYLKPSKIQARPPENPGNFEISEKIIGNFQEI